MASRSSAATVERRKKPFRRIHSKKTVQTAAKRISDGTEYMDIELQALYADTENGIGVYNRGFSVNEQDDDERLDINISEFIDDIASLRDDQAFQNQIARKMRVYLIGRQEAEIEVLLDRLVEVQGGLDKALLYVVSTVYTEIKVETFVRILLFRGANTTSNDCSKLMALHHAVRRGLNGVCSRLLEYDADPLVKDQDSISPLSIALSKKSDEIAALLLQYIPAASVRKLFTSSETEAAELSFHHLINCGMQKTALGVLDCMLELSNSCTENYRVYYQVLEADECGRAPDHPDFNSSSKSALQLIARVGNKEIGYHNVVRLLVRRKWRKYAKWRFQFNAVVFLISLFALTYAAVVAADTTDTTVYNTPLQYSRAAFEAIGFLQVAYSLILEVYQMCKHKTEYWKDRFNWHDLISIGLLLSVIPLRYSPYNYAQWQVFSAGFLFWTFRIFKYAPVFRQTGAYSQTLWRVLIHDFPQFTILFAVVLLAFSGSFLLALRGENMLGKNQETSDFWNILFTGVRTLVEGEPITSYTGAETQYGTMGAVLMVLFLISCSIILLNILIAQLSDTYQHVQNDALRALELNRAWIVARVEMNSVCTGLGYRKRYYREVEEIPDLQQALGWDEDDNKSPYNKLLDHMASQMSAQEQNMVTIKNRMARQERLIIKMHGTLQELLDLKKGKVPCENNQDIPLDYHSIVNRQTSWQNGVGSAGGISRQDSVNSLNGLLDAHRHSHSSNSSEDAFEEAQNDVAGTSNNGVPRYQVSPGILRRNGTHGTNGRIPKNGHGRTNGHHGNNNGYGNPVSKPPVVEVVEEETSAGESRPCTPQTPRRCIGEQHSDGQDQNSEPEIAGDECANAINIQESSKPEEIIVAVQNEDNISRDSQANIIPEGNTENDDNDGNIDDDIISSSADSADVNIFIGDEQPLIQEESPEEFPDKRPESENPVSAFTKDQT